MQAAEHLQEILMGFQHFQTSTQKLAENDPKLSVLDIFFLAEDEILPSQIFHCRKYV